MHLCSRKFFSCLLNLSCSFCLKWYILKCCQSNVASNNKDLLHLSSTFISFTIFAICSVIKHHKETKAIQQAKIVAAFRGMHVSPAKHSFRKCDRKVWDGRTDDGQSDPYESLCFAGDTKTLLSWNAQKHTVNGNEYPKQGILQIFRVQTLICSTLGFWNLRSKPYLNRVLQILICSTLGFWNLRSKQ